MYDCATCAAKPFLYQALGHDGPPQGFWRENLLNGEPLACCPVRTIERIGDEQPELVEEVRRHELEYFPAYVDGHLLVAGGLADQPARYLAMMRRIRSTAKRVEERYHVLTKPEA